MKKILVTGGTGTVGRAFINWALKNQPQYEIICFSRDELKQFEMSLEVKGNVFYAIGDVRDKESITAAAEDCDYIIHTAALKHVRTGERYPIEVVKTNVIGTKNVVDAANYNRAKMVLVSTDKAVQPENLYGATKMIAEHFTLTGNQRVVRFGNIFGSRGSVLHRFRQMYELEGIFKIHDKRMTRFIVTANEAANYIWLTVNSSPGKVFVPALKAISIVDLAYAFDPEAKIEEIGAEKGEKIHEFLQPGVSSGEAERYTVEEIRRLIREL